MNKIIIIAEAGVNHNGCIETAKALIDVAASAGVDYVKFQSFKASRLVSPDAPKAQYQKVNFGNSDNNQFQMLKDLELSDQDHLELLAYCKSKNLEFFSTAFDTLGLDYLNSLGMKLFKVPSGEITNYPYLKKLAEIGKPVIISTGMSNLDDIQKALDILEEGIDRSKITVLHCNTEYPTPMEHVNLKAMKTIESHFNVNVGYSDHTMGIEVPIAATALGANVIEKHFTLDRNMEGPDHKASLEPKELVRMVKAIRNIEVALSGSGLKEVSPSEQKNITVARKSIHTRRPLRKGTIIKGEDLIPLRPGDGISPMEWEQVCGKKILVDYDSLQKLDLRDLG